MKPPSHITDFNDGAIALPPPVGSSIAEPAREKLRSRVVDVYELTKPRMNFLVVLTTLVGYFVALQEKVQWMHLLHTILGTALTAAGASVLNQYTERDFDGLMPRTSRRPLPANRMSPIEALAFGVALGCGGVLYLYFLVNVLTALLGAFTLGSYVFLYTPLKRITTLCTVIGAIPGAIPPMMGWTAVTGGLSPEAISLFAILFLWQMPHFLAIAILYKDDYAAGGFKMLPVVDPGLYSTSRQIVVYGLALIPVSVMPVMLRMAGVFYFAAALILGSIFLAYGVKCAMSKSRADARKLFFVSIIYLPVLLGMLIVDKVQWKSGILH